MKTERVDDIPLLIAEFEKSELSNLFNQYFPDHGNWSGADGGKVAVSFLTYVLSCSDHRISHVETWASERIETLRHCLKCPSFSPKDLTDDRLESLLDRFSDKSQWDSLEHAHNQRLINIHSLGLKEEPVRLDSFITQSHREAGDDFQYGYAKQHRSDLPQLKTMVAALDPLSMPLYSVTVSGNISDDDLYLPIVDQLLANLPLKNQLFVGDSKMGNSKIRTYIDSKQHYYLMPLNRKQCTKEQMVLYLDEQPDELITIWEQSTNKEAELKAKAFEKLVTVSDESEQYSWQERRILVYSPSYAKRLKGNFEAKVAKAMAALEVILIPAKGRKKLKTHSDVVVKVDQILNKYQVKEFIDIQINERIEKKRIRGHLNRPTRTESTSHFSLEYKINQQQADQYLKKLGWQIYACNAPEEFLTTEQIILCYRNEYKIEHKFDELLNRITALMPVFLKKPNRIKALIQLLLLALKYVSLIQFQVRKQLKTTKQTLKELYPGNPGRATDKPTTNMILRAFRNITLVIVSMEEKTFVKISDLKPIQLKILKLLDIPPEIYLGFNELVFSNYEISET